MICPKCNQETYHLITKYVNKEMVTGCLQCLGSPKVPDNELRKQWMTVPGGGKELHISPAHLKDIRSRATMPDGTVLRGQEGRKYQEYRKENKL